MQFKFEKYKNMPYVAKVGCFLWLAGWIWLIGIYYYLTKDTEWVTKLSIAIVLLAIFVYQAQNWSRLIAVLSNLMGILLSGYFFLAGLFLIAGINVVLFGGAIYFLMVPATKQYFKIQSQPDAAKDTGSKK